MGEGVPFANGRQPASAGRQGRPTHGSDAAPAARSSLRRSSPCRGHPLDQGKSDQTSAGLLAHGSSLGHMAFPGLAGFSVRPSGWRLGHDAVRTYMSRSPLTVAGTAADLDPWTGPHRIPFSSPSPGNRRDLHPPHIARTCGGQGSLYSRLEVGKSHPLLAGGLIPRQSTHFIRWERSEGCSNAALRNSVWSRKDAMLAETEEGTFSA